MHNSINRFIDMHANCKDPKRTSADQKPAAHLLDLLRTRLLVGLGDPAGKKSNGENSKSGHRTHVAPCRNLEKQETN